MKKFILFLSLIFLPLLAFGIEPAVPDSWAEVISNFNTWFATLGGIAAVTVFVAGAVIKLLHVEQKWIKQGIAWLIAIILVVLGNLFNFGFSADFPWLTTIAYGFAAGLVANGIFDIEVVKSILEYLTLKKSLGK